MTVLQKTQEKKVTAALALSRAGAGELEKYDAAVSGLGPEERELALRQAGRELRHCSEQLAHLGEIADALERLAEAGAYRAIVLDVLADDAGVAPSVWVAMIGQPNQVVAGLLPDVVPGELEFGDEVELVRSGPDHFAVRRRLGRHRRLGAVARIQEILPGGLLRTGYGPDCLFLRASLPLQRELAEFEDEPARVLGRLVSFDEQIGVAFSLYGEAERDELVLPEVPSVKRDELILSPRLVGMLEDEILLPLRFPDQARDFGVEVSRFFLFHGAPGNGKTHAARWLATELGRPVYLISGAELADQWYGATEGKLRARLEAARREPAGAVVIWDEAESMLGERGRSSVGVEDRMVSVMLTFMDGFENAGDVLMILTTNRPDQLDGALKRQLRALPLAFERPDAPRTRQLFELYLRDVTCADADPETLAREAALAVCGEREPVAEAVLRDSARVPVTRAATVSGALVRATCERARRLAFTRFARSGGAGAPRGVLAGDVMRALDEQFEQVAGNLTVGNLGDLATLPPEAAGQVVALERRGDSGRRHYVSDPLRPAGRATP